MICSTDPSKFESSKLLETVVSLLKCRGQFINGVSVIRINCKNAQEKPVLMGLLWVCFV